MESYYSSDEEIAWGPITLKEIKGDLKRPRPKPVRRCSMPNDFQMELHPVSYRLAESGPETESHLCKEDGDLLNVSPTSTEYYTPNGSLRTDGKFCFLEKISKVIDQPQLDLSVYASALENTKVSEEYPRSTLSNENLSGTQRDDTNEINDSCLNFVKAARECTFYDIADFQQSLVENSVMLKDDTRLQTEHEQQYDGDLCDNIVSISVEEELDEDVVFISDNEEAPSMSDNTLALDDKDSSTGVGNITNQLSEKCNDPGNEEEEDNNIYFGQNVYKDKGASSSHNKIYEERQGEKIEESTKVDKTFSRGISPIMVDNSSTLSDDAIAEDDSLRLNDTLEEMNRLLSQGLNYTMSDEEESVITENTPCKDELRSRLDHARSTIISGSFLQNQPVELLETTQENIIRTPSKIPVVERKPTNQSTNIRTPDNVFKIPNTALRPTATTPKACLRLKNVVSPVGIYIKNSPTVVLKQNIPPRKLNKIPFSKGTTQSSAKENFPELPEVVYKPARKQIVSSKREVILPPSLKKLNVKEPVVIKHEGRIRQPLSKAAVSKKLLEGDITNSSFDSSALDSSSDISILTRKQAFIK